MVEQHVPFMVRARRGDFLDIRKILDDEVDLWHNSPSELSLHEWLGMSEEEYTLWVERPKAFFATFPSI
jgi:hypothetical protein